MEEKYLVSLQEIKFAIESEGGMDIGDFNYDTLVDILELIDKQQKEIKKLTRLNSAYKTNFYSKVLKEERKNKKILEGHISKDKIREKLKELQAMSISGDIYYTDIEKMFYELLEE